MSSTSSQEFLQTSYEKASAGDTVNTSRKSWKFSQISDADDSNSEQGNESSTVIETSFNDDGEQQHYLKAVVGKDRPPSLSEVPLPPPSMLNETHEFEVESDS